MTDQDLIKSLQQQVAQLQRERDVAVGAINMYRLSLQRLYALHPSLDPAARSAILSDLKSHLNGPLIAEIRELAIQAGQQDSFAVLITTPASPVVSPEQLWDKFIMHVSDVRGYTKPDGGTTMKNFLGSIEKFKVWYLEAQNDK